MDGENDLGSLHKFGKWISVVIRFLVGAASATATQGCAPLRERARGDSTAMDDKGSDVTPRCRMVTNQVD